MTSSYGSPGGKPLLATIDDVDLCCDQQQDDGTGTDEGRNAEVLRQLLEEGRWQSEAEGGPEMRWIADASFFVTMEPLYTPQSPADRIMRHFCCIATPDPSASSVRRILTAQL